MTVPHRFRFTKTAIDRLPAPETGYIVAYDEVMPELGIRVNAGGRRSYFGLLRHNGRTERVRIDGAHPTVTPELARQKLKAVMRDMLLTDLTPREAATERKAEPILRDAFAAYREHRFTRHGRRTHNIDSMFGLYLEPLADTRLSEITRGQVEFLHADIPTRKRHRAQMKLNRHTKQWDKTLVATDQNVTGTMANKVIGLLSAIYTFAASHYPDERARRPMYAGANPAAGIEKHDEQPRQERLRKDQAKRFFEALAAEPDRDFKEWVLVALWTGARSGNTRSMRWADIDLEAGEWTFTVSKGRPKKNGQIRSRRVTVALATPVSELLRARQARAAEDAEYVFPANTASGYMGVPKKKWEALLARAKVKTLRMHSLRHSAASWAADAGATGPVLQAMLTHSDPKMSARYTHLHASTMRQAVDAMADLMLANTGISLEQLTQTTHSMRLSRD